LRAALERLNPALRPEAISAAVDELARDRSAMLLAAANRDVYSHISFLTLTCESLDGLHHQYP
jgi:hypothetical protein